MSQPLEMMETSTNVRSNSVRSNSVRSNSVSSFGLRKLFQQTDEILDELKKTKHIGKKITKEEASKQQSKKIINIQNLKKKRRKMKKQMAELIRKLHDNEKNLEKEQEKNASFQKILNEETDESDS